MKVVRSTGIVLARTNYGEADRILTLLTPDHGKLRLMARGVRKVKSKLAGGIELFSTSDITYMLGRGEIGTLVSARLNSHFAAITADYDRLNAGYDFLKQLHRATEDEPESSYYDLLEGAFVALNTTSIPLPLIRVWFAAQLLQLSGHTPNLVTDAAGQKLLGDSRHSFDYSSVAFTPQSNGTFTANHIKTLRLLFAGHSPEKLITVEGVTDQIAVLTPVIFNLQATYIRT